jgi:tetraacyldisaccharide 4'-kinase
VIQNGGTVRFSHYFDVRASHLINLKTGECYQLEQDNLPVTQCHAVCGIGNPEKFKATLQHLRIAFDLHVFADHHHFQAQDFQSFDDKPVIMTEKDAVKCRAFAKENWWYVTIDVVPNNDTIDKIQQWI